MVNSVQLPADRLYVAAVESIYNAAIDPSHWPQALQSVADVFDDVGAVMLWKRDDGGFGVIASHRLDEAQADYQANGWYLRDTRSIRAIELQLWLRSDALTERDFISDEEIANDPFYTQFLARYGLRWCAAIGVAPDPNVSVGLSVQRHRDKLPYSDAELDIAANLGRHAEKSLRLSIRLLDAELAKVGLGKALSRVGIAVFALDALGRVLFANPAATNLPHGQIEIRAGRLHIVDTTARLAMDGQLKQTRSGRIEIPCHFKPILLHRSAPARPLVLYLLPISVMTNSAEQILSQSRAIVLVVESDPTEPVDPTLVRDILGLTLGEARVAAFVGSGMGPREAAKKLGITEETARTALKRVFAKVGVSRQGELTALLTKLVMR